MAASLGISGTARMRKGDLIAAIEDHQADSRVPRARAEAPNRAQVAARGEAPRSEVRAEVRDADGDVAVDRAPRRASRAGGPPETREDRTERDGHGDDRRADRGSD